MSTPKAPADPVEAPAIDARLVRKIADILKDTGLSEIEVEHAGLKIRVARELTAAPVNYVQAAAPAYAPGPAARRRSVREGRRHRFGRPDPADRRSHEDHEPDRRPQGRQDRRDPGRR